MFYRIPPVLQGISLGTFASIVFGLIYLVVLREPISTFYPFAGLVFLGGPFIGGVVAAWKTQGHRRNAVFVSSLVTFGIAWMLFILAYLVLPLFDRASVQLPEVCDESSGSFNPPPDVAYTLPSNAGVGVLITGNAQFALVAVIDYKQPPFPSTVFLVNKSADRIIKSMDFNNDIISAAIEGDTLYIYNDKIGYFIDARTGELENDLLTIDNYGGLSESENPILLSPTSSGHWYYETSAVITSWGVDGSVKSRRHLTLNGIALGCFVYGDSHNVTVLK
jgi:hypothetical protein